MAIRGDIVVAWPPDLLNRVRAALDGADRHRLPDPRYLEELPELCESGLEDMSLGLYLAVDEAGRPAAGCDWQTWPNDTAAVTNRPPNRFTEPMTTEQTSPVVFYWRPGCGFCMMIQRGLDRHGIAYDARNIWEDGDAAEYVRSVAGGNETVPTVLVGDTAMVNPTIDQVLAALPAA